MEGSQDIDLHFIADDPKKVDNIHIQSKKLSQQTAFEDEAAESDGMGDSTNPLGPFNMKENAPTVSFDEALHLCGGFGRFQFLAAPLMIAIFTVGFYLLYGYSILTNYPVYEAKQGDWWVQVEREYICDQNFTKESYGIEWRIDYSRKESIKNWVDPDKLDLTCTASELIGFTSSIYFVGFALSAFLTPQVSDKYGRRVPVLIGQVFQIGFYTGVIFCEHIYMMMALFFGIGLTQGATVCVVVTYLNEFIPEKYQSAVSTVLLVADASLLFFQAIIYKIVPNWWYPVLIGYIGSIVLLLLFFRFIPESPCYYYVNREYDLCRKQLQYIASFNRAKIAPA